MSNSHDSVGFNNIEIKNIGTAHGYFKKEDIGKE